MLRLVESLSSPPLMSPLLFSNSFRTTSEEKRYIEREIENNPETTYSSIRRAAEVHRQVRAHARRTIRPGMSMTEICENIENGTRALVEEDGFEAGIGFPTGVNLNECAAHFSPNANDKTCASTTLSQTEYPYSILMHYSKT
jgi:methionyl aminopeptidase